MAGQMSIRITCITSMCGRALSTVRRPSCRTTTGHASTATLATRWPGIGVRYGSSIRIRMEGCRESSLPTSPKPSPTEWPSLAVGQGLGPTRNHDLDKLRDSYSGTAQATQRGVPTTFRTFPSRVLVTLMAWARKFIGCHPYEPKTCKALLME